MTKVFTVLRLLLVWVIGFGALTPRFGLGLRLRLRRV